jgi:hypothetical protein
MSPVMIDKLNMEQLKLNELFEKFMNGKLERKEFEGLIFKYLSEKKAYYNFYHWNTDEYDDFLSTMYPRLQKAIDAYRDSGSSFEVYICNVMRMSEKEYRTRLINKSITEYTAWSIQVPDMYAYDETPSYVANNNGLQSEAVISGIVKKSGGKIKNPRQLLALVLKCYYYVSDDFIERIAPVLGLGVKELNELINKLRALRCKRDNDLYLIRERIYCQFYRCIVYEKKLSLANEDSNIAVQLKIKIEKARKRLEKMRKRMAGMRSDATNRQVAQIMGVKKGSIDSCLYNLKTKWNIDIDKSILN